MSGIRIIAVGSLKEPYLKEGEKALLSFVSKRLPIESVAVPEEKAPERLSEAGRLAVLAKEGEGILKRIKGSDKVAALAIQGKMASAYDLKALIDESRGAPITFVIGGSLGLGAKVLARADCLVSFGRLTFPHQMMRVILLDALGEALRHPGA